MHAHWILFMCSFQYIFYHKIGPTNQIANALSRQSKVLMTLAVGLQDFEYLKEQYAIDPDYSIIWIACQNKEPVSAFHIAEGFLFHGH